MPGALAYTDEQLNIVVCNDRFAEMYPVPRELLQRGRPYPELLRYLASTATTAKATSRHWSPSAWKACATHGKDVRGPHAGRTHLRSLPSPGDAGGTVTVITDVTELRQAEARLAHKEAELHVALDNMPGALAYTDEELNIVICNDRFAEMYPVPARVPAARTAIPRVPALSGGARLLRGQGMLTPWSPGEWRVCAIPRARRSRTIRRMARV